MDTASKRVFYVLAEAAGDLGHCSRADDYEVVRAVDEALSKQVKSLLEAKAEPVVRE